MHLKDIEILYLDEVLLKIESALLGTKTIASVTEVLEWFHVLPGWEGTLIALKEGTAVTSIGGPIVGLIAKLAMPLTAITTILTTMIELYRTFTFGRRVKRKMGFCYALVCKAAGLNLIVSTQAGQPRQTQLKNLRMRLVRAQWTVLKFSTRT